MQPIEARFCGNVCYAPCGSFTGERWIEFQGTRQDGGQRSIKILEHLLPFCKNGASLPSCDAAGRSLNTRFAS
jgi:hypothetical protein